MVRIHDPAPPFCGVNRSGSLCCSIQLVCSRALVDGLVMWALCAIVLCSILWSFLDGKRQFAYTGGSLRRNTTRGSMSKAFGGLAEPKKIVLLVAIIIYIVARAGWSVPREEAETILGIVVVWVGAQGAALLKRPMSSSPLDRLQATS